METKLKQTLFLIFSKIDSHCYLEKEHVEIKIFNMYEKLRWNYFITASISDLPITRLFGKSNKQN